MLRESLREMLQSAQHDLAYDKGGGRCLGYPGTLTLFAVADAIGSYFEKNPDLQVSIGGRREPIGKTHFRIFNSRYYNLGLERSMIMYLGAHFRNPLSHNALIRHNCVIFKEHDEDKPFFVGRDQATGQPLVCINLRRFGEATETAVELFLEEVEKVVSNSRLQNQLRSYKEVAASQAEALGGMTSIHVQAHTCVSGFITTPNVFGTRK